MPPMKEKIKNLFAFIGAAWRNSLRGKAGVGLMCIAIYVFLSMFWGTPNIQRFFVNMWRFNTMQTNLIQSKNELAELERHNALLQKNSPDYIEEIGLSILNIGDSKTQILRF